MTPPDRAPEPLHDLWRAVAYEATLDAARDSRPRHSPWRDMTPEEWDRAAEQARDSRPVGEGPRVLRATGEDAQSVDLIDALEEHGIYSRGDLDAALQAGPAAVRSVERELDEADLRRLLLDEITEWRRLRRETTGDKEADEGYAAGLNRAIFAVEDILSTTQPASTEAGE